MKLLPILGILLFVFTACDNSKNKTAEDVAEVADQQDFKDQHELPEKIDFEGKGELLDFDTPDGKTASAYTLKAETASNKYLFVIHEWWGLNDQIKQEAERLFDELEDVNVMALDLYDGEVTDQRDRAAELTGSRDKERLRNIVRGAKNYAGTDAKIATIGWCFGGGWSVHSTLLLEAQAVACVVYYGAVPIETAKELAPIQTDVLGIFAEKDQHITLDYANKLKKYVESAGQTMTVHAFDADHAFANPSSPRYAEEAAQKANKLALDFLKDRL